MKKTWGSTITSVEGPNRLSCLWKCKTGKRGTKNAGRENEGLEDK